MNFSVFTKQICRFLIQRYMGQYLKTELTSDQLELHLADGTASVQGVQLNSEYINETLEASGVHVLSLKDGYVEELTVCVPWKRLLLDSTIVKINGLQLTVTPLQEINMANTQQLMCSFVGSIASSMELAKSVIVDEQLANGADNTGIEQCASLIDQIIARIKVQFENVTVRLEAYSADLCTGIEIHIDRLEFLDEQLEEQQRNASSSAITEQPDGLYTVTDLNKLVHIQGIRLYTDIWSPIRDNRMFTSRTSDANESDSTADMASSAMNFQSCYSHFSSRSNSNSFAQQKSQDMIPPNPTLFAQLFDEKHTLRIRVKNNAALSYADNSFYNKRIDVDLFFHGPLFMLLTPSQIVLLQNLFALLAPKAEVNNAKGATPSVASTTADEFSATAAQHGGVPMGPQQYAKLIEQMQKGVYASAAGEKRHQPPTTFGLGAPGSWSGTERFYDLSELVEVGSYNNSKQQRNGVGQTVDGIDPSQVAHQAAEARYRSNSLDSDKPGIGAGHINRQSNASIATLVERRPDIFSISVRAPALVAVITHDDPLSVSAVVQPSSAEERSNGIGDREDNYKPLSSSSTPSPLLIASIVEAMNERAEQFFTAARRIKIGGTKRRLEDQRAQFVELYAGDCLRFVGNDFFTSSTFTTSDSQRVSFESKAHLRECDFIECLQQNDENGTASPLCVDILNIVAPDDRRNVLKNDILSFQVASTPEKPNDYKITISMEQCKTDVDFSLMDRISALLCAQPFFATKNNNSGSKMIASSPPLTESVIVRGLKDNFEVGGHQEGDGQAPATFHVKCHCNKWLMNLRIPIASSSSADDDILTTTADANINPSYRKRALHPEYVQLALDNVNLEMPKFSLADLRLFWALNLECKTAKGTFIGDPTVLQCSREAMTFFVADASNADKAFGNKGLKLELRYDGRNKALSNALLHNGTAAGGDIDYDDDNLPTTTKAAMYESFYCHPAEADRIDGPFSKKNAYFTYNCASNSASLFDQKIIMAGGRHEMLEFAKECQQHTNFAIELFISQLNIAFPCQKFFELLYNRIAFDLALWQPKAPLFANTKTATDTCEFAALQHNHQQNHQRQQQFTECFSSFLPFNGNDFQSSDDPFDDCATAAASGDQQQQSSAKRTCTAAGNSGNAHLLTVGVHVAKVQALLQTTVVDGGSGGAAQADDDQHQQQQQNGNTCGGDTLPPFNAQLLANLVQSDCFLVYGFCEDPNLAYAFLTSAKAEVFHHNLLGKAKPICADVTDTKLFAAVTKQQNECICCVEEASPNDQPFERVEDDNLAIALKMQCAPEPKNTKNIFVAFGLRNSLIHLRPFAHSRYFWVSQFANFFTVADYDGVPPGFVQPKVEANLHVHLESVFACYDHRLTTPSSPFQLRIEIGLAYLTSNIVKDIARLKFDCHLQDLIMWMSKKPPQQHCPSFNAADHTPADQTTSSSSSNHYYHQGALSSSPVVKVLHCEAIHFIVAFTIAVGEVPGPLFDFECANNAVTVWLCADTVIEFVNILMELYKSDTVQALLSNDAQTEQAQQQRLYKLIECSSKRNATKVTTNASGSSSKRSLDGASSTNNISLEEEERLIKMMEAAMSDFSTTMPPTINKNNSARKNGGINAGGGRRTASNAAKKGLFEIDEEFALNNNCNNDSAENWSPNSTTTAENTDDEYILIDTPPKQRTASAAASGVTQIGDQFQTRIDMGGGDYEFVTVPINGHQPISKTVDDLTTNLAPLFRFEVALSLDVFLFGGTDFGDSARTMSRKTYSKWNYNNLDRRMADGIGSQGGKYRDHTVIVQVQLSKLSFVSKVFDKCSPILSYNKLRVADFKVFDHLSISHINEMIHRLEGQRAVNTPFFSGYLIEDPLREAILRISMAPIRLNIDQDTIEFLMDFKNDLVQSLRATFDRPIARTCAKSGVGTGGGAHSDDIPLMEVSKETAVPETPKTTAAVVVDKNVIKWPSCPTKSVPIERDLSVSFKVLKTRDELLVAATDDETTTNLDGLFSEDDVQFSDSFCAKFNFNSTNEQHQQPQMAAQNLSRTTKIIDRADDNESIQQTSNAENCCAKSEDESSSSCSNNNDTTKAESAAGVPPNSGLAAKDTFIKDFSFSPACLLRIDYEAKRVKTDQQGALIGFLIGMANLNKTELTLKELRIERGFLGIERCAQFVVNEWVTDIKNKQFPNVVGSLAPINALVQLAQGFHDLFALPYDEFRKENGQLLRGFQRGTTSFGLNAATAAIDATQRVVGLVQNVAELAFDIVNPNYQRQRRLMLSGPQRLQIAGDLREGFSLAYNTVREGVLDTAQTLQAAAAEDRALGGLGMGVLRHMTPSAIKPFVIASKATAQVLGGLKNQLKPEDYREELRKWRQTNGTTSGCGGGASGSNGTNIRRQGSSGTMPSSTSSAASSAASSASSSSSSSSFQQKQQQQQTSRGVHW